MPNYIDKDKLIRDLIDNRSFYPAIVKRAIENAPTEDVVPRSEYDDLLFQFKELDIECSRLEKVEKKLDEYKKFVGEIRVTNENHAVIIDTEHTEYIDKRVAEGLKNLAVKQAKREVAREIFEELAEVFKTHENYCKYDICELLYEDLSTGICELQKKYIGEK